VAEEEKMNNPTLKGKKKGGETEHHWFEEIDGVK